MGLGFRVNMYLHSPPQVDREYGLFRDLLMVLGHSIFYLRKVAYIYIYIYVFVYSLMYLSI